MLRLILKAHKRYLLLVALIVPSSLAQFHPSAVEIFGESESENLGSSVSLSDDGKTVAVSSVTGLARVRVFDLSGGSLQQIGNDILGEAENDRAGVISLSGDGKTLIIGGWNSDANGQGSGSLRVFRLHEGDWQALGSRITGDATGDWLGYSVAINTTGNVIAVGAPQPIGFAAQDASGYVKVYKYSSGEWQQKGETLTPSYGPNAFFGHSVALDGEGNVIAVGASNDGYNKKGEVSFYSYSESSMSWGYPNTDSPGYDSVETDFGANVDITEDGNFAAVIGSKTLELYRKTSYGSYRSTDIALEIGGQRVALSGDGTVLALGNKDDNDTGSVKLYKVDYENSTISIYGEPFYGSAQDDWFGLALDLDQAGFHLAVGAIFADELFSNVGKLSIFSVDTDGDQIPNTKDLDDDNDGVLDTIDELPYDSNESKDNDKDGIGDNGDEDDDNDGFPDTIDDNSKTAHAIIEFSTEIYGEALGDRSGYAISTNDDGSVIAIGASGNDGNGSNAGHLRIFRDESGEWVQIGADIDGEAPYDESGVSVALSGDGSTVIIGAPSSDSSGNGQARVFRNYGESWRQLGSTIEGWLLPAGIGYSVDINAKGNMIGVGAKNDVIVYTLVNGEWEGAVGLTGEKSGDRFGAGISMTPSGDIIVIGSPLADTNGTNSGNVSIWERISSGWRMKGSLIGGPASFVELGWSVDISNDGETVVAGVEEGFYVYVLNNDEWQQLGTLTSMQYGQNEGGGNKIHLSMSGNGEFILARDRRSSIVDLFKVGEDAVHRSSASLTSKKFVDGALPTDIGLSVAISGNASRMFISSPLDSTKGEEAGLVRSFFFDSNGDGLEEISQSDLDGDGVRDELDAFPADPGETKDTDLDGIGNNTDQDDDGDGVRDMVENFAGGDPLNPFDADLTTDKLEEVGLNTSEEVSSARILGQQDVTASPESYGLATIAQVDAAAEAGRTIVNVSARVDLGEGEIVTPGFTVLGEQKKLLIRAVGPKLVDLGVPSPMQNPTMSIYKSRWDGNPPDLVATIDDWKADNGNVAEIVAAMNSAGAFPLEPTETFQGRPFMTDDTSSAAALVTLDVGVYTVQVSSADEGVGEVLVEVYEIND